MGTTYTLIDKGGVAIELDEMSSRVGVMLTSTGDLPCMVGTHSMDEAEVAYGPSVLDDDDLIAMAFETLRVACYISANPETVRRRLEARMKGDIYLGDE